MIEFKAKASLMWSVASGEIRSHAITISNRINIDFEAGDPVAIYGAGQTCTLPAPTAPKLSLEGGGEGTIYEVEAQYEYAAVAVDENFGYSELGEIASILGPPDLNAAIQIHVEWEDTSPQARHLAVYRRVNGSEWALVGGLNANPYGSGIVTSVNRPRVALWDDGLPTLNTAKWWPSDVPESPQPGMLRTFILNVDGDQAILLNPLEQPLSNGYIAHDASIALQDIIDNLSPAGDSQGGKILVPSGSYQMHADLIVDKQIILEGEGAFKNTIFQFEAGRGLVVENQHISRYGSAGQWSVLRDFAVSTTSARFLPNGSRIAAGA